MRGPGPRWGESLIQAHWNDSGGLPARLMTAVTAPLSTLFGLGVRSRGALYDRELLPVESAPIPVVSVGNLSVGGTGKTPTSRWVVESLTAMGHSPALVSRGYGADELALHRRWYPQVPVIADPDRVRGVRSASAGGATVAVLDDGFQHRRLARDLDIVLVSRSQPMPPRLLPRGPYREPLSALRRAGVVLVTVRSSEQGGAEVPGGARALADELRLHAGPRAAVDILPIRPDGWRTLGGQASPPPRGEVLAVCSVADPERFRTLLEEVLGRTGGVDLLPWPDHHPYDEDDLRRILSRAAGRTIVTTEKDAVKLHPLLESRDPVTPPPVVLAIRARPPERLAALLRERLDRAISPSGGPVGKEGP